MKLKNKESKKDIYSMSEEEKKALWAKNDKEYSFPKTLEYTMEELMDDYIADQKHKYGE